ncbi:hypothetical protein HK405_014227 [Cladochytrium tenue]|nr:hypothetical protein HK405_014227 [Cladochytrium tenue]
MQATNTLVYRAVPIYGLGSSEATADDVSSFTAFLPSTTTAFSTATDAPAFVLVRRVPASVPHSSNVGDTVGAAEDEEEIAVLRAELASPFIVVGDEVCVTGEGGDFGTAGVPSWLFCRWVRLEADRSLKVAFTPLAAKDSRAREQATAVLLQCVDAALAPTATGLAKLRGVVARWKGSRDEAGHRGFARLALELADASDSARYPLKTSAFAGFHRVSTELIARIEDALSGTPNAADTKFDGRHRLLELCRGGVGGTGILVSGPSGSGKSALVRHAAPKTILQLPVARVSVLDLMEADGGSSADALSALRVAAARAAAAAPAALVLDDLDLLESAPSSTSASGVDSGGGLAALEGFDPATLSRTVADELGAAAEVLGTGWVVVVGECSVPERLPRVLRERLFEPSPVRIEAPTL